MSLPRSVAEVLKQHVTLEVEKSKASTGCTSMSTSLGCKLRGPCSISSASTSEHEACPPNR